MKNWKIESYWLTYLFTHQTFFLSHIKSVQHNKKIFSLGSRLRSIKMRFNIIKFDRNRLILFKNPV